MEPKLSVRDRIFQAALERIKHYGYGKTTMAEIAGDCGMSPGNIYRFFEAKIDIAEAIARNYDTEMQARLSAIARRKDLPADQRLREVLATKMRENYALLSAMPKVVELVEVVRRERPMMIKEDQAHERVFLVQIIRDGNDSGQMNVADPERTAAMIQIATMKFVFPQLFSDLPLPKLEEEFDGVMDLILNGIYSHAPTPALTANEN
jgi:AcrR family transcriptional regulator